MDIRKSQASLSGAERTAAVNAFLALKNDVPSQLGLTNRYDDYVQIHVQSMMTAPGWAHRGPAFCPWHRVLLRNLELDLQAVDASVTLPYWDWTVDNSPDPTVPGSPWTDDFLGGDGDAAQDGKVLSGPFAFDNGKWPLNILDGDPGPFLARALAAEASASTLPTPANVQGALQETPYDRSVWGPGVQPSFRDRLEGWHGPGSVHNRVHLWVGGSMTPGTSPNDPVFFLHHCNVDRLWAQWQRLHPGEPYLPAAGAAGAPQGHRLDDPMQPWGGSVTPASTLDYQANLGYRYDTDPAPAGPAPPPAAPSPAAAVEAAAPPSSLAEELRATIMRPWQLPEAPAAGMSMMHMGPMFDLSPEDKAAGGHDKGS
ncbi:MAG TPA: tyrosinase family protein [Thermoanaerobaculia bacterium]|nr:tyrosinase family protein [Thermoanaerobaculia bacterium]